MFGLFRGLGGDVRLAGRSLRRNPGFSLAVILTLGIGVGLVTATAGLVNAYLVRALPYPESDRLVFVEGLGAPDWRSAPNVLLRVAAWDLDALSIVSGGAPERVWSSWVTPGFFQVLGVQPALGRVFNESETAPGGPRVALISHGLWQRRWAGSRAVIGQTFSAYSDDRPDEAEVFTIVGVLPADFWYFNRFTEVLAPLRTERRVSLATLAPGVTPDAAQRVLAQATQGGDRARADVRVVPVRESFTERARPILGALAGAVLLVLLLACGNAATLLLVRSTARQREFSIRAALGAGRARMARQLLLEGLALASGAALIGMAAAWLIMNASGQLFERALGTAVPGGSDQLRIDRFALTIALAVSTIAALLFTLIPQLATNRLNLIGSLIGTRSTDSVRRQRARSLLVGLQIALSLALLIGAGLLTRSALHLQRLDLGFDARNVVAIDVSMRQSTYNSADARADFFRRLVASVREQVPGATVALTRAAPLRAAGGPAIETPEHPADSTSPNATVIAVTPEYFQTLGITLLAGANFDATQRTGSDPVAIISASLARRLWPGQDAIGRRLRVASDPAEQNATPAPWSTVIGVAVDARRTVGEETPPDLYVPVAQAPPVVAELVVRDPAGRERLNDIRRAAWLLNPELPLNGVRWLEDDVRAATLPARFLASVLAAFAAFAVLLATLGLYGVVAFAVLQRRRDIAIRMALGATSERVVRMFVRQGLTLLLAGGAAGMAGGFFLSQLLRGLLHGTSPADLPTYAAVFLVLTAAALLATWLPAQRAARAEPMQVLQEL
jgi:putative ABC transport system permease protein